MAERRARMVYLLNPSISAWLGSLTTSIALSLRRGHLATCHTSVKAPLPQCYTRRIGPSVVTTGAFHPWHIGEGLLTMAASRLGSFCEDARILLEGPWGFRHQRPTTDIDVRGTPTEGVGRGEQRPTEHRLQRSSEGLRSRRPCAIV